MKIGIKKNRKHGYSYIKNIKQTMENEKNKLRIEITQTLVSHSDQFTNN